MEYFDDPEWRHLVAAVRADPADDTLRLAAADWLDEHDRPGRADVIRRGVAKPKTFTFAVGAAAVVSYMRRRKNYLDPPPEMISVVLAPRLDAVRYTTGRGFVERVTCPAGAWLAYGDMLLAREPIVAVKWTEFGMWDWHEFQKRLREAGVREMTGAMIPDLAGVLWPGVRVWLPGDEDAPA